MQLFRNLIRQRSLESQVYNLKRANSLVSVAALIAGIQGVRVSSLRSLAFPSSLPLISSARMDIGNNRLCESYLSIRLL